MLFFFVLLTLAQSQPRQAGAPAPSGVAGDKPSGLPPEQPTKVIAYAGSVPLRARVSQGVMQGLLIKKVKPDYPPDAKKQRVEGVVLLQVDIDKGGNVYKVDLISGHPLLAPAAIEAVKQWRYKPFRLNGEAVIVETQVKVNFVLKGNHSAQRAKP